MSHSWALLRIWNILPFLDVHYDLISYKTFMMLKTKIIHQREKIPRIKKQGFPVHYPFKDFKARYVCINIKNRFKIPKDEKEGVR